MALSHEVGRDSEIGDHGNGLAQAVPGQVRHDAGSTLAGERRGGSHVQQ